MSRRQAAAAPHGVCQRLQPRRQCRDSGAGLPGPAHRLLADAENRSADRGEPERACRSTHTSRSTMTLPRLVDAAAQAGFDEDGRIGLFENRGRPDDGAGRKIEPRPDRAWRAMSPANHTGRSPRSALSPSSRRQAARSAARSNAGRRPMAAVRNETILTAMPGATGQMRRYRLCQTPFRSLPH